MSNSFSQIKTMKLISSSLLQTFTYMVYFLLEKINMEEEENIGLITYIVIEKFYVIIFTITS